MATNTIRIHRVLRAAPEQVYRAVLDADAYARWLGRQEWLILLGKLVEADIRA